MSIELFVLAFFVSWRGHLRDLWMELNQDLRVQNNCNCPHWSKVYLLL